MKCPHCGQSELTPGVRDMPYVYKGRSSVIENVAADYCPSCGEGVMAMGEAVRTSALMIAFNKQVNAELVAPDLIVSVRRKLSLNQRQAGELFGGGVNAFSKYETGKTQPPLPLVQLFKLLDRHPELLSEIQAP